jgi:hypothetical protein
MDVEVTVAIGIRERDLVGRRHAFADLNFGNQRMADGRPLT